MTFAHITRPTCITSGSSTLYRVWMLGREVCATNNASLATWAEREALRHLARWAAMRPQKYIAARAAQQELAA